MFIDILKAIFFTAIGFVFLRASFSPALDLLQETFAVGIGSISLACGIFMTIVEGIKKAKKED